MHDYEWARRWAPKGWLTLGDLCDTLRVGPKRARQILREAFLPPGSFYVTKRCWREAVSGRPFSRRFIVMRAEVPPLLFLKRVERSLRKDGVGDTITTSPPYKRLVAALEAPFKAPKAQGFTPGMRVGSRAWRRAENAARRAAKANQRPRRRRRRKGARAA